MRRVRKEIARGVDGCGGVEGKKERLLGWEWIELIVIYERRTVRLL